MGAKRCHGGKRLIAGANPLSSSTRGPVQTRGVALLALLFAVPGGTPAHATPPDPPVIPVRATFRQPRDIVDDFTRAVDRGELLIYRRPLERSAIIPVRVEYVYDLRTLLPTIKIYSRLTQAIPPSIATPVSPSRSRLLRRALATRSISGRGTVPDNPSAENAA